MYAKVIIDIKHEDVNRFFDYIIPQKYEDFLERGMRVLVPFGKQTRMGYVTEIITESLDATKEILEVLDVIPSINEELFSLMNYIKNHVPALYSSIFSTVIPSELAVNYTKVVEMVKPELVPDDLKPYFNKKGIWRLKRKDQVYYPRLKKLRDSKDQEIIKIKTVIKEKGTTKTDKTYTYNQNHHYKRIYHYEIVIDLFNMKKEYTRKELTDQGLTASNINTLVKNQVLFEQEKDVFREIEHQFDLSDKKVVLTDEQQNVVNQIVNSLDKQETFLLKGITGSGKTEVYLEVISKVIEQNKQVLVLVPEITLVAQMAKRLKSRFDDVAIYHSALSSGERFDQYKKIQSGKASIVLGTRSAVFLPMEDLGLVIIDEEHDDSYIQKEQVIYDAVEIALERAKHHQIPVLLGSATPSITSMYEAMNNRFTLLELTKRPLNLEIPTIQYVDMRLELEKNNTSIFSKTLLDAMKKRIEMKEQTILLFNRKGYAPFVLCRACGDVPQCPHCDISLTYYKEKKSLKCHYCGYEKPFDNTCSVCNASKVKEVGTGIEYVEQVLKKQMPKARVLRMDKNATRIKGSHEIIWNNFLNEEADILLGTQMIAKGLDFPKVTLVGVLMADLLLKVPSYKSTENAYMLLAQVTGRSGRFYPGEAIIQGYDIGHFAIKSVNQTYETFYQEALYNRKLMNYPPFKNTSQILISGESYLKTYQRAFMLKKALSSLSCDVLGPSQALITKIKDYYRFTITLKYETIEKQELFDLLEAHEFDDIKIRYFPYLDIV
ncbi:replication restart helicase PriA [Peloplasma aerotolerans]|uniref:Replication restart protein PriA n=1 Tax=Peloplasma aerotolerans TaxID=3044389 RepID=A0AAW6UEH4_9MOLU|nr:primosomal protein N' [Mariniplasma sp. M4Ah]MDI6453403.1 primosomal protein N' [Mariniplasma sp. M4Ah]MDR4968291.1 primosomal protein N' [Acholeplasmataceae bacterium]